MFGDFSIWGAGPIGWLVPFLFVLTIIVFFHELGHFLVARWCGVRVLVFSVGFGTELFGFTDRHGTRWKFSAIPLGGYVKFFGDENAASVPDQAAVAAMSEAERQVSFPHKSVAQRAAVVAAGPVANFLLAIVIYAGISLIAGKQVTEPRIDVVKPESAAAAAGFEKGDMIVAVNGKAIESFGDVERMVMTSAGERLTFTVQRKGQTITIVATPEQREERDRFGNVYRVGRLDISGPVMRSRVSTVQPGSAAAAAGLEPGDLIQSIDGVAVESFNDLRRIIMANPGRELTLRVLRNGVTIALKVTPTATTQQGADGKPKEVGLLGVGGMFDPGDVKFVRFGLTASLANGVEQTWFVVEQTMSYVGKVIVGRESADQVGGPIRIAQVSGQMASLGLLAILNLAAMLSVSIGLLNLFPIPLLDGGHLLFYGIEAVRGRPLSERAQEMGFRIGLALVLMLMVFATYNDISGLLQRVGS